MKNKITMGLDIYVTPVISLKTSALYNNVLCSVNASLKLSIFSIDQYTVLVWKIFMAGKLTFKTMPLVVIETEYLVMLIYHSKP